MPKKQTKPTTKKRKTAKKAADLPANLCVNCAPIGHTEVMAMLLVAVFGLAAVMSIANVRLDEQHRTIDAQAQQIQALQQQ